MTNNLEDIGLAAVDRFIDTWNSRDPEAWAATLNYPHVRPGPFGPLLVAQDAEEYISRVDFSRVIASGWDHSEWDYKHVLHISPRKIHVVGQWGRYNKEGERILTNPVTYIVTLVDGKWGVQSRFSADFADDEDTSSLETRAFKLIEVFVTDFNTNNTAACAELLNYPHFSIGIGSLDVSESAGEFALPPESTMTIDSLIAVQTGLKSCNVAMDFTLRESRHTRPMQAVLNVTERDDHLGIQGWSLLDPAVQDQS